MVDVNFQSISKSCACFSIKKSSRVITNFFDRSFAHLGLRSTQFSILVTVKLFEPVSLSKMADHLCLDAAALSRNTQPLTRKGLLRIETSKKDRRSKLVVLTEKGNETLNQAIPIWNQTQAKVLELLGQDNWESTQNHLSQLARLRLV